MSCEGDSSSSIFYESTAREAEQPQGDDAGSAMRPWRDRLFGCSVSTG